LLLGAVVVVVVVVGGGGGGGGGGGLVLRAVRFDASKVASNGFFVWSCC
jgi:hypothetical protein